MKKRLLLPAVLLFAALLFSGCPSAPAGGAARLTNPDISFDINGVYWYGLYDANAVQIEAGKTYIVTIDVTAVDDVLGGCHFMGQLFYKDAAGNQFLLAGSQNSMPQAIADYGKKYRLTFTAGDYGTGATADDTPENIQEGGYQIPADPTTPAGLTQYLKLTVETPNWYKFGLPWDQQKQDPSNAKDNWDVDYYGGEADGCGFVGTISFEEQPDTQYLPGDTVSVLAPEDTNGKGKIDGDEFLKLKNAPAQSLLRVYCTANVAAIGAGSAGGTQAEPGWGTAEFGPTTSYKIRGQNISTPILIPKVWQGQTVTANPSFNFYDDVLIDDILGDAETDLVYLNVYNGGKVTNMVVMSPSDIQLPQNIIDSLNQLSTLDLNALEELIGLLDQIKALLAANN